MSSKGDPRVLFVMNVVLSSVFAIVVVWGLSTIDLLSFTWVTVAEFAVILVILTYVVTR